jgi:hypothetical protein
MDLVSHNTEPVVTIDELEEHYSQLERLNARNL